MMTIPEAIPRKVKLVIRMTRNKVRK